MQPKGQRFLALLVVLMMVALDNRQKNWWPVGEVIKMRICMSFIIVRVYYHHRWPFHRTRLMYRHRKMSNHRRERVWDSVCSSKLQHINHKARITFHCCVTDSITPYILPIPSSPHFVQLQKQSTASITSQNVIFLVIDDSNRAMLMLITFNFKQF